MLADEWCELRCEESELDLHLNECRKACDSNIEAEPLNKMQEYLNCMHRKCLRNGDGPNDIRFDEMWIKCATYCKREQF